jgi:hypothetical protein
MTHLDPTLPARRDSTTPAARRVRHRPHIQIDGDTWKPRSEFAHGELNSEKTVARMNLRTAYIAGVAYDPVQESLREIAARARRRNEPPRRRSRS